MEDYGHVDRRWLAGDVVRFIPVRHAVDCRHPVARRVTDRVCGVMALGLFLGTLYAWLVVL